MNRKKGFRSKVQVKCEACGKITFAQRRRHISSPLVPIPHQDESGLQCFGVSIATRVRIDTQKKEEDRTKFSQPKIPKGKVATENIHVKCQVCERIFPALKHKSLTLYYPIAHNGVGDYPCTGNRLSSKDFRQKRKP